MHIICILFHPPLGEQSAFSHSDLLMSGWGDRPLPAVSSSPRADTGPHLLSCHHRLRIIHFTLPSHQLVEGT